jgi:hypothetical protein
VSSNGRFEEIHLTPALPKGLWLFSTCGCLADVDEEEIKDKSEVNGLANAIVHPGDVDDGPGQYPACISVTRTCVGLRTLAHV